MQSIVFICKQGKIGIEALLTKASYKIISSEEQVDVWKERDLYVSFIKVNSDDILGEFEKEELLQIPFSIGSVYLYQYNDYAFAKEVLFLFLENYLNDSSGENGLYLDIEDSLYPSQYVYKKIIAEPYWDWRLS